METCFRKNTKKGGSRKVLKISPKKSSKWVPNWGGAFFGTLGSFLRSESCSDLLCCWNAPGPSFFTILASLFLHFCVAARFEEQPFNKKTNTGGSRQELKIISKRTPKMRPILRGGALMKHFPSAVHWNTREAALPRRMASWIYGTALIIRARHGNTWHRTDPPDPGTAQRGASLHVASPFFNRSPYRATRTHFKSSFMIFVRN